MLFRCLRMNWKHFGSRHYLSSCAWTTWFVTFPLTPVFIFIASLVVVLNFDAGHFSCNSFKNSLANNRRVLFFNWSMENPRLTRPAGFSSRDTCLYCAGCVNDWISPTRFATKSFNFLLISLIHQRMFRLSHYNVAFFMLISYKLMTFFAGFSPKDALNSSNHEMYVVFNDAILDLDSTIWVDTNSDL